MGAFRAMSAPPLHRLKVVLPNLTFTCHKHENSGNDDKNEKSDKYEGLPEAPTTCCMSGCPDCVWLDYAEKLSQIFQDGGEEAKRKIEEKVSDPNIKAFLLHELRMKKQKK